MELRRVTANRGWPSWRTAWGDEPSSIRLGTTLSRGHRLSYEMVGSGPPIVLVPGFTMLAADWREMGYTQRLQAGHLVLAVDPLGHGLSDKPIEPEAYYWPEVAADVVAVMDDAGIDRAVVWGYSRGADLAAAVAIDAPDRVAALILGGEEVTKRLDPEVPAWVLDVLATGNWAPYVERFGMPPEDEAFARDLLDPRALAAVAAGNRRSGGARRTDLGVIQVPGLVYCGSEDDPDEVRKTAMELGVPLAVLPGRDHDGGFAASDEVLELVQPFLAGLGEP